MKKPNMVILIIKTLFRIAVVMCLMVAIALCSFEGVSYYLNGSLYNLKDLTQKADEAKADAQKTSEDTVSAKIDQTNTEITMFVMQSADSYNQYITLNMRNTETNKLDVVLVPLHSKLDVSKKVLKEIQKEDSSVLNPVNLYDVAKIYGDKSCDMIREILEDALQINISGYDLVSQKDFKSFLKLAGDVSYYFGDPMTYRDDKKELKTIDSGYQSLTPEQALVVMTRLDDSDSEESDRLENVSTYLETFLPQLISNCKASKIAKKYESIVTTGAGRDLSNLKSEIKALDEDSFTVRILQGSEKDDVFTIDTQKASLQISTLIKQASSTSSGSSSSSGIVSSSDDTEDAEQTEDTDSAESSKNCSIELFNAAYVEGIAGKWEGYLESEGYSISMLSNYEDGPLSQTRIVVTEEGMGEDLLTYFPDAEIEVGTIDTGGDIRVYIGTDYTEVPDYTESTSDEYSE